MTVVEYLVHSLVIWLQKLAAILMPFPWPRVFEGQGSAQALCQQVISEKRQRVLFVTSPSPVRTGLVQPLIDTLQAAGITVTLFDRIKPDPTVEQIEEVVTLLQQARCDAVLVLGGGSCIDAAKVIAARAKNPRKSILQMAGLFKVTWGMLPLYAIPTTAGTGSEVSIGAVVTDTASQRKLPVMDLRLLPRAAALDGALMAGVPRDMTAATGMDALTHAVEAFISRNAFSRTDAMALEAVRIIMADLETVVADGGDIEARHRMARASFLAGKAFTQVGVGYVHAIAHNFGAMYHLPHGRANAIIMPYVLEYSLPDCAARLALLARATGIAANSDGDESAARAFIARIRAMNVQFGIPAQVSELQAADIPRIARNARDEARFTYAVPRYMTQAQCEAVVRQMLVA